MFKVLTVIFVLLACCYCAEDEVLIEVPRASKKKKTAIRLWVMALLFVLSKVAVLKVASFMFFFMIFQKLFYFGGILLNFFMKQKFEKPSGPPTMYGPPAEYNTIGYSYGPPENNNVENVYPGPEYGLPSLTDIGGLLNNRLFNKNV